MTNAQRLNAHPRIIKDEAGLTLFEILAGLVISGILAAGIAFNTTTALRVAKLTELNHAASRLASDKMEELAAVDSLDLDDTYDATEAALTYGDLNITFTRVTDVTINADNSRTIDVTVSSNSASFPATVNFATTFALWE